MDKPWEVIGEGRKTAKKKEKIRRGHKTQFTGPCKEKKKKENGNEKWILKYKMEIRKQSWNENAHTKWKWIYEMEIIIQNGNGKGNAKLYCLCKIEVEIQNENAGRMKMPSRNGDTTRKGKHKIEVKKSVGKMRHESNRRSIHTKTEKIKKKLY